MGISPIPVSETISYARAFGFGDIEELLSRIKACDRVFLKWCSERQKNDAPDMAQDSARKLGIELPPES